jgi:hypothetical protein
VSERLSVPACLVECAETLAPALVPLVRTAGYPELEDQVRGRGDAQDLIATLSLFAHLSAMRIPCAIEIRAGGADRYDLEVLGYTWNIKASRYAPAHEGLHLFVKAEELNKQLHGYIQTFVHLDEEGDPQPHLHIAGVASAERLRASERIILPRVNHPGVAIPCRDLTPWSAFLNRARVAAA